MSNRLGVALGLLTLVCSMAVLLEAQEAPRDASRERERARFQLEYLSAGQQKDDATVFDGETGRVYIVDDLDVVRTIDPVAGTVTVRALRDVEREAAVRAVVAAVRARDATALRGRMTRALLLRHPDVQAWVLELEADLGQQGVEAWLRKAHFRFEDDGWRLDL